MNKTCVIFDLDDTLFKEREFLKSAYKHIADKLACSYASPVELFEFMYNSYRQKKDTFTEVLERYPSSLTKKDLLNEYRNHYPSIKLDEATLELLEFLYEKGMQTGLLTDGRSLTQRNKIRALGLNKYFQDSNIIISEEFGSEKPSPQNYLYFESKYPAYSNFIYIGDNPQKDFVTPNDIGWKTFGLVDNGDNIHPQLETDESYQPQIWVKKLSDIIPYLDVS